MGTLILSVAFIFFLISYALDRYEYHERVKHTVELMNLLEEYITATSRDLDLLKEDFENERAELRDAGSKEN